LIISRYMISEIEPWKAIEAAGIFAFMITIEATITSDGIIRSHG